MTRNRDTYPARCVGQQAIVTLRPLPCSPVGSPRCPPAKSVRGKRRNRLTGPAAAASSTPMSKSCRVRPGSSYWMHQQGSPSFPRPSHGTPTAPGAALRQHYLSPTRSPRTARLPGRLWRHGHPSARIRLHHNTLLTPRGLALHALLVALPGPRVHRGCGDLVLILGSTGTV